MSTATPSPNTPSASPAQPLTWLITGASRGLGAALTRTLLAAGHRVVATARKPATLTEAFGEQPTLLPLPLDVTRMDQIDAAVHAAVHHFGRIDVLVNNAGFGQMGFTEQIDNATIRRQYDTNVFGMYNLTRAVLPVMRRQRSGRIFNISSIGGLRSYPGAAIYCSTKFAMEALSEGLTHEVKPLGIHVTLIEPGYFRTDFLDETSVRFPDTTIDDYQGAMEAVRAHFESRNHQQPGDPAKFGSLLLALAAESDPPVRLVAGSDAVALYRQTLEEEQANLEHWAALSVTTDGAFATA